VPPAAAVQLRVAADERPFGGPALKRLVQRNLHGVTAAADGVFVKRPQPPCRSAAGSWWPLAAERVIRWADELQSVHMNVIETAVVQRPPRLLYFWPVGTTLAGVVWTVAVSPHTAYGANWATDPILVLFVSSLAAHILLIVKFRPKWYLAAYAVVHSSLQFCAFLFCLMLISKDSF